MLVSVIHIRMGGSEETVSQLRISKFFAVKVGGGPQLFQEIGCIPTVFIVI